MCQSSKAPCGPANSVRSGAAIDRSDQPQDPGHRLRSDATQSRSRKGSQGSVRSHLAQTAQGTQGLLADRQASDLPVSRQDSRRSATRSNNPNLLQDGSRTGTAEQARYAAHFKTFLCDGTLGGRSRLDGHQQIVGPQQLRDDDGLSALPKTTSRDGTQSDRLATSQAMPEMGRPDNGTTVGRGATGGTDGNASETLSVHDILRKYTPKLLAKQGDTLAWQVTSTLARIGYCRTKSLGSHVYHCGQCDHRVTVCNSCGDRNCPQCAGARRASWLDRTAGLLLPDMPYFQVVFTIPDTLSPLILGNRRELYNLLFRSAWGSLNQSLRKENGQQASAAMVLHTWNQKLEHHPHVHALVPGAAPSLDGTTWVPCRMTKGTIHDKPVPFLVDNKRLGWRFRDKFVAGLERLVKIGKLEVVDMDELKKIIANLSDRDWVVYIEGPPTEKSSPEHVLKYLARYLTGGPISDLRSAIARRVGWQSRILGQSRRWQRQANSSRANGSRVCKAMVASHSPEAIYKEPLLWRLEQQPACVVLGIMPDAAHTVRIANTNQASRTEEGRQGCIRSSSALPLMRLGDEDRVIASTAKLANTVHRSGASGMARMDGIRLMAEVQRNFALSPVIKTDHAKPVQSLHGTRSSAGRNNRCQANKRNGGIWWHTAGSCQKGNAAATLRASCGGWTP